jgi:hypothetical protein
MFVQQREAGGKVGIAVPLIRTEFPHAVECLENIWVPLADGTRLAAKVWRPADGGRYPAILEYLPYRKRDGTRGRDQAMHMYLAGHGYACIRLDIRGTGDSEGLISDEYTVQEQQDGVEAIAWIAAQDWCDGQVAMIGISWGGFNGLQIAALQPPALKTVISLGSTDDRYATDVHYIGGCLSKDNFDWSATMLASNDQPPDPAIVGKGWRDAWQARMEANSPWILAWLAHQRRDDYWKQGSVCEDFSRIRVPVYAVSGWADNYSESVPRLMAGLTCARRGLIGPWAHSFPFDVTVGPAIDWLAEVVRWCDHWLKGQDTGIMDEPMLRVWMQEAVPPQTCYLERPGRWVGEAAWPSARIRDRVLHLNSGGRLADRADGVEEVAIKSPLWVGLAAGEVGRYGDDADWPTDQREDDAGSLVFLGAVLEERTEILGAPRVTFGFASDKPLALVAVRLNDVAPDGASTRVTVGLLNLTHRNGHEVPEALNPGEWYEATVELDDIAHAFPAGHRIAVSISTVYWPIAWPSPELVRLRVRTGESTLSLPVRPVDPGDAGLREFGPAIAAANTPVSHAPVEPSHPRRVTRDLLSGRMTVDFPRWTYAVRFEDIDTSQTSTGSARYEVTEGDPLSATLTTEYRVETRRPDPTVGQDSTVGHHSTGRLSCDATHFRLDVAVRVWENGEQVFSREWHERIARDHI